MFVRVLLFLHKLECMLGLTVKNTKNKIVFTIDKNNFTEDDLLQLTKIARLEYLIKKADFSPAIMEIGKEIKENWWQENKTEFLKGTKYGNS